MQIAKEVSQMLQVIIANHINSKRSFSVDEATVCIFTILKRILKYDSVYTSLDNKTPRTKKAKEE